MEIKIVITSNIKGKLFAKRVMEVIDDLGIEASISTVSQTAPVERTTFYTPALFVDDRMLTSGKVLSKEEITHFFL